MNIKFKKLLLLFIVIQPALLFGQRLENMRFKIHNKKIIVNYDLVRCPKNFVCDVKVRFKYIDSTIIIPTKIKGDLRNITEGINKTIIWDPLAENKELYKTISATLELVPKFLDTTQLFVDELQKADDLFDEDNYTEALTIYTKYWHRKNFTSSSQVNLGLMYEMGNAVTQSYEDAAKWYQKAVNQDNSDGQFLLGTLYKDGLGVNQNNLTAIKLFQKAADQGNVYAYFYLDFLYYCGLVPYKSRVNQNIANNANTNTFTNEPNKKTDTEINPTDTTLKKTDSSFAKTPVIEDTDAVVQKELKKADEYYNKRNYIEAFNIYNKYNEHRLFSSTEQRSLGFMYDMGKGTPQNDTLALKWYQKSAENGNDFAQFYLGTMYKNGFGTDKNYAEALKWFLKAAEQKNVYGQYYVGLMYATGLGTEQNYTEAAKWYQKAADQGDGDGENSLGELYYNGTGVAKNYNEAFKLFQKSVTKGQTMAHYNLGLMYEKGLGCETNLTKAKLYYKKAAEKGIDNAKIACKRLGVKY